MNRVIAFSLYGTADKYNVGMIRNALLAPVIYPGWTVRIYATPETPARDELKRMGCDVIDVDPAPGGKLMSLRFLACLDSDVAIFRDADSRLNPREAAAVNAWLAGKKKAHMMRDHEHHRCFALFGGMWGVRGGVLPRMGEWIKQWPSWNERLDDMLLLQQHAWPILQRSVTHHTSVENRWGGDPFPAHQPWPGFVGQQHEASEP